MKTDIPNLNKILGFFASLRMTRQLNVTLSRAKDPVVLLVVLLLTSPLPAAPESISAASILARTKILSSDEFEGRAPGSPGEEKTVAYLVGEFQKLGLAPGNPDGTYLQNVPLVGITSTPTLSFTLDGQTLAMENINDFIGPSSRVAAQVGAKDSEVVFVGYGVVAPEFGWDDYKGVNVRGKTVVMLVNDPPVIKADGSLDDAMFKGKAMTYYGRWTYKYEIAAARGAAACLIVHETAPAAYPFAVLIGSRSRENFEISAPDGNAGNVAMEGWLTVDAARKLFTAAGKNYDTAKAAAAKADFRPVTLGAPMSRFGNPDELAAMVAWLCTEDCSFSTGAVFDLSGGRSTY